MADVRYQALLSNPQNLAQVQAGRVRIERVGGRLVIAPPTRTGLIAVTLYLPPGYYPDQFLPGLPFYPI
jgi:hypothetical protein